MIPRLDIGGGVTVADDGRELVVRWNVSAYVTETAAIARPRAGEAFDGAAVARFNAAIGFTGRDLAWILQHIAGAAGIHSHYLED